MTFWLDWHMRTNSILLIVLLVLMVLFHTFMDYNLASLPTSLLVGLSIWIVYCYFKYGVGIG